MILKCSFNVFDVTIDALFVCKISIAEILTAYLVRIISCLDNLERIPLTEEIVWSKIEK